MSEIEKYFQSHFLKMALTQGDENISHIFIPPREIAL
jgi:hypothetical protein